MWVRHIPKRRHCGDARVKQYAPRLCRDHHASSMLCTIEGAEDVHIEYALYDVMIGLEDRGDGLPHGARVAVKDVELPMLGHCSVHGHLDA